MSQAKTWFSAAELAGLPGLPKTESGTIRFGKKTGWEHRSRIGRGGGREYPIRCLPKETQTFLRQPKTSAQINRPTTYLSKVLREARGSKSKNDFADEIGVSLTKLSNYERGRRSPDMDFLLRVSITQRVQLAELIDACIKDSQVVSTLLTDASGCLP